jgi:hypothetical protein
VDEHLPSYEGHPALEGFAQRLAAVRARRPPT